VQRCALESLGLYGKVAAPAVPTVIRRLKDAEAGPGYQAAKTLGKIGPDAAEGIPALTECLKSPHERIRDVSAFSLGRMGALAKDALPHLERLLDDVSGDVVDAAQDAIAAIKREL
jgi:HEAT repeat protein